MTGRERAEHRPGRTTFSDASRGLSGVLGIVLLVAILVLGSILIVTMGASSLDGVRASVGATRAELALSQLDVETNAVALGVDDQTRRVNLGLAGQDGQLAADGTAWMRVDLINATISTTNAVVANESIGRIGSVEGETAVGFEDGGVWRRDRGGSAMVAPRSFTSERERSPSRWSSSTGVHR